MTDDAAGYLLDNARAEAGARFAALSAIFDPPTFRRIDSFGIEPGWRCAGTTSPVPTLPGRGADLAYGRRLPGLLRAAGLVDVAAGGMDLATAPMVSAWGRAPG
ncbi:hypothetical protein ABZ912_57820 [Nonomuraea angiospora]|uniref:hypothetical protein n=1 Tax=Nonomuraea angiospora TaxID=46172 RepID=UPI0033DAACB3